MEKEQLNIPDYNEEIELFERQENGQFPTKLPPKDNKDYVIKDWGILGKAKIPRLSKISKRRKVSTLAWSTLIFLLLAYALCIIAFASPAWGETTEQGKNFDYFRGRFGIIYMCARPLDGAEGRESCEPLNLVGDVPGWWKACQAFAIMQMFFGIVAIVTIVAYICMPSFNENIFACKGLVASSVAATVTGLITWIIFCILFIRGCWECCKYPIQHQVFQYWLSYAFHCSIVSSGFFVLSSVTAAYETIKIRNGDYHW